MVERNRKVLGDNIKKIRLSLGITQEALAEEAHLHRTYIGAVERGERNVSLDNIVSIASALHTTPSDLLAGVGIC